MEGDRGKVAPDGAQGWGRSHSVLHYCLVPRKTLEASAICRYDLAEIQTVFTGPFMEYQNGARRWGRYEGGVPEPRPGSVSTQAATLG